MSENECDVVAPPDKSRPLPERLIYQILTEYASDVLVLVAPDLRRLYISPACRDVLGYEPETLLGEKANNLVHPDDLDRIMAVFDGLGPANPTSIAAWRARHPDGSYRWKETTYRYLPDGHIVGAIRDIQERKDIEEQLAQTLRRVEHTAMRDLLTDLPNRRCFIDTVERTLSSALPHQRFSLVLIDLDCFKPVNDAYGHAVGDQVLAEISTRFARAAPASALVARLGGDEFAVLLGDPGGEAVEHVVQALLQAAVTPIQQADWAVQISASIGVACYPRDGEDCKTLLLRSDTAMYAIKQNGRSGYRFFDHGMDEKRLQAAELRAELRTAIQDGDVTPDYQPLVSLQDGRLEGFEALARWHHPFRGTLMPGQFIPAVEDMRLEADLLDAIIGQACRDAAAWPATLCLSVNISPLQLADTQLPRQIMTHVKAARFDPARLIIEVTETLPTTNVATARAVMTELQDAGIRILLDDFGTGHSGLQTLQQLPFDGFKIDRSFVTPAADQADADRYLTAIVGIATTLGLALTAEGIETEASRQRLQELGCATGQGYLFSRPIDPTAVPAMIERFAAGPGLGRG